MYSNTEEFTHNTPQILKKKKRIKYYIMFQLKMNRTSLLSSKATCIWPFIFHKTTDSVVIQGVSQLQLGWNCFLQRVWYDTMFLILGEKQCC